jgi:hypothetical protein
MTKTEAQPAVLQTTTADKLTERLNSFSLFETKH